MAARNANGRYKPIFFYTWGREGQKALVLDVLHDYGVALDVALSRIIEHPALEVAARHRVGEGD